MVLCDLYNYSLFLFYVYKTIKNESEENIKNLVNKTNKCGPLAIKLLQFICMNYNFKTDKLKYVLENCNIHSFVETKKLYFLDFNKEIEDDYIIDSEDPIGSGSIGQVYCLYSKELNKKVAIKVKHPDIDKSIKKFVKVIKILLFFVNSFTSFGTIVLQFINNIESQLDYSTEASNTDLLRSSFKNEKSIIIPEIYNHSFNFIIMSYHDGISFNEITDPKLKMKISLYLNFIAMSFLLLYDLFHGDLHYGNWKINTDNGLQIIIYDCGIVYSSKDLDLNKEIIKHLVSNNYNELLYTFNPTIEKEKIKLCIDDINKECIKQNIPTSKRIKFILNESIKNKLLNNKIIINLLNSYAIISETIFLGVDKFNKFVFRKHDIAIIFYMYIEILNNMEVFDELKVFLQEWMDSDEIYLKFFNEWLMNEFGHTDYKTIGKIIYDKIV